MLNRRFLSMAKKAIVSLLDSIRYSLVLHLDASDVNSYDGSGDVWYDIAEYDYTPSMPDYGTDLKVNLNASDSASYGGSGTTWTDIAGSNNGTNDASVNFGTDTGGFFDYNGSVKTQIPHFSELESSARTWEFWIRFDATLPDNVFFAGQWGSSNADQSTIFKIRLGKIRVSAYNGSGTLEEKTGSKTISADKWHHVVVVSDNSDNSLKIFVDGELDLDTTLTIDINTSNTQDFFLGQGGTFSSFRLNGKISAFRFYSKALSASEVGQNYRHGRDYIYDGLAGTPFLHYDPANTSSYSGTGTTLTDLAGNNNGALVNGLENNYDEELGNSFDFASTNQSIQTNGVSINPANGMTIEMWFKIDSDTQNYLFSFNGTGTTYNGLSYRNNTDKVEFFYRTGANSSSNISSPTVTLNKWHHLVATTDGSGAQIYLDGVVGNTTTSNAYSTTYNETIHFGNLYTDNQAGYHQVGQIRFYKGHLTADEVMQNYLFTKNKYPNEIHFTGNNISSADWNGSGYFDLDGSSKYFETSGNPSALINATNFTIQAWAKMHTTGTADYIVSQTTADGGNQNWLLRFNSDNKIKFYVYGTDEYLSTTSTYSANTWYHVAGVVEADGTVKIYVNGTLEASSSSGKSADTNAYNTFIGSLGGHSTGRFDGNIGAVKYYSKALTESELLEDYNTTKSTYGL